MINQPRGGDRCERKIEQWEKAPEGWRTPGRWRELEALDKLVRSRRLHEADGRPRSWETTSPLE